jgi:hypothetical protein
MFLKSGRTASHAARKSTIGPSFVARCLAPFGMGATTLLKLRCAWSRATRTGVQDRWRRGGGPSIEGGRRDQVRSKLAALLMNALPPLTPEQRDEPKAIFDQICEQIETGEDSSTT